MLCDLTLHNVICQIQFTRKRNHRECCDWITNVGIDGRQNLSLSPSATDITSGPSCIRHHTFFPPYLMFIHLILCWTFELSTFKIQSHPSSTFWVQFCGFSAAL